MYVEYCWATSSWVTTFSLSSCWAAVSPAISFLVYFAFTMSFSDATRTMKNSSRLDAVMLKNFSLSNSGICLSLASDSTLLLNRIQLSSRLV